MSCWWQPAAWNDTSIMWKFIPLTSSPTSKGFGRNHGILATTSKLSDFHHGHFLSSSVYFYLHPLLDDQLPILNFEFVSHKKITNFFWEQEGKVIDEKAHVFSQVNFNSFHTLLLAFVIKNLARHSLVRVWSKVATRGIIVVVVKFVWSGLIKDRQAFSTL